MTLDPSSEVKVTQGQKVYLCSKSWENFNVEQNYESNIPRALRFPIGWHLKGN